METTRLAGDTGPYSHNNTTQLLAPATGSTENIGDYYSTVSLPTLPLEAWAAILAIAAAFASAAIVARAKGRSKL